MDLEIRIDALEAEVKVLKNEIQDILLEIQEQILQHYYPTLRTDDGEPSETLLRALEGIREKRSALSAEPDEPDDADFGADDGDVALRGKPTSLESLRRAHGRDKAAPFSPPPSNGGQDRGLDRAPAPAPSRSKKLSLFADAPALRTGNDENSQEDEWQSFSEMLTWVQNNIGTMGEDRIHSVIELYRQEGFVSSRVAKALERSIALFS